MHTINNYIRVITYVDVDSRSRVHKIVANYLENLPHVKTYRVSKIGIKEPCIIIASNRYTEKLFSRIRRISSYCEASTRYINYKTDRWNYYFTPYYKGSYTVVVRKDIANNCLLWK